jgi:hypothetical protein
MWIFLLAGMALVVAGLLPLRRGENPNVVMLIVGALLLLRSFGAKKRSGESRDKREP